MSEPNVAYRWHPLEDLSHAERLLASPELEALAGVWLQQRETLQDSVRYEEFVRQLSREWAIETGILERLYTLDRGVTQLLIERGIDAAYIPHDATDGEPEHVADMIADQEQAIEGLFAFVKGDRPLSTSYLKQLHAAMTAHQETVEGENMFGRQVRVPLRRGEYKKLPNNPRRRDGRIHEYCPPEHVEHEVERLIECHLAHGEDVAIEVEAAWLHHRFTQIHPFQDGNGRLARSLATLVFLKDGWFPLVVRGSERADYVDACEAADAGSLAPLVEVFVRAQKRAFVQALGIVREVSRREHVADVIAGARATLARRARDVREAQRGVFSTADRLQSFATRRMQQIRDELEHALLSVSAGRVWVDSHEAVSDEHHFVRYQVVQTARALGYFADLRTYQASVRLTIDIRPDPKTEVLVGLQAVGPEFRGVIAAAACFYRRELTPEGGQIADLEPLVTEPFLVGFTETPEAAESRFAPWLEGVLTAGLEAWRAGL